MIHRQLWFDLFPPSIQARGLRALGKGNRMANIIALDTVQAIGSVCYIGRGPDTERIVLPNAVAQHAPPDHHRRWISSYWRR